MKILTVLPRRQKTELEFFREIFSSNTDIGVDGNDITLTIHNSSRDKDAVGELQNVFKYKMTKCVWFEDENVYVVSLRRHKK